MPPKFSRKMSNDLAASNRIAELRQLQNQLASVIRNENDASGTNLDNSVHSTASLSQRDIETGIAPPGERAQSFSDERPPKVSDSGATPKPKAPVTGPKYSRKMSNELGSSSRIAELRQLQSQLASVIRSENDASGADMNFSTHSNASQGSDSYIMPVVHKPFASTEKNAKVASTETLATLATNSETSSDEIKNGDTPNNSVENDPSVEEPKTLRGRLSARSKSFYRSSKDRSKSRDGSKSGDSQLDGSRRSFILSQMIRKKDSSMDDIEKQALTGRLPKYEFLVNSDKERGSLSAGHHWWHAVFFLSLISFLACVITLWAPYPIGARMPSSEIAKMPWSNGCVGVAKCICPRETVCADDLMSMIFLTIARGSAWFDYPLYMILFLSKCSNLNNFLQTTAARCWVNFSDSHKVHSLFGCIVAIETTSHTFFHLLRWTRRNNDIQLLWTSKTGVTGLIAFSLVPLIVLPMAVPFFKNRMKFEWRKGKILCNILLLACTFYCSLCTEIYCLFSSSGLHYLAIVWGAALMVHAPQRIFWLIGVPLFIYTADYILGCLFKCHLVESAHFQRLGDSSCLIEFVNPTGFGKQNSAYVYLMLPWISKTQFHAFTVFPGNQPNHSSICIHKCGDWTEKLMKQITIPAHKPAFVCGPFLSPFSSPAMDSEFLVAVASGIGVTPAISLIKQYSHTSRRLNLVWICRDAGLVEHFLQNVEFSSDGYSLIYYTGKRSIILPEKKLPSNVFLFNGRPYLERTISGIIYSIVSGMGLPEELSKKVMTNTPADTRVKLLIEKALSIYTVDQLFDYTLKASNYYNESQDELTDEVNYQGVLSTMRHLLANDCNVECITAFFERVDIDGNCRLNREEFRDFIHLMIEGNENSNAEIQDVKDGLAKFATARDLFQSKRTMSSNDLDEFGIKQHLCGGGKFSAKNWSMLYCGGSAPVLSQLKDFKNKYCINLSVEKFDW